jgi:hypothetical protein
MEHYITLFDSLFLPQGLALHMSMERYVKNYQLWILCVDDEAFEALTKLNLVNVRLLQLSKLENEELLRVKEERTRPEYCWTLTPFAPRFVFEADLSVTRVTYLDADLWFCKSPELIFDEFDQSGKHVLITDHAYAPEYDQSEKSGQYCVQFMTFTRDKGELVRKWWEEKCIEWCYARFEEGKFGDQKYLDDWPNRFNKYVHVLNNKELALAPWNAIRFPYGNCVFWHFHGLRLLKNRRIDIGSVYSIPTITLKYIYRPYIIDIAEATNLLESIDLKVKPQKVRIDITVIAKKIIHFFIAKSYLLKIIFPPKY